MVSSAAAVAGLNGTAGHSHAPGARAAAEIVAGAAQRRARGGDDVAQHGAVVGEGRAGGNRKRGCVLRGDIECAAGIDRDAGGVIDRAAGGQRQRAVVDRRAAGVGVAAGQDLRACAVHHQADRAQGTATKDSAAEGRDTAGGTEGQDGRGGRTTVDDTAAVPGA